MRRLVITMMACSTLAGCDTQRPGTVKVDNWRGSGSGAEPRVAAFEAASFDQLAPEAVPDRSVAAVRFHRMITRTAQIRAVVLDPVATVRTLSNEVEAAGGYVSDSRQWTSKGQPLASLTIRIPDTALQPTIEAIRHRAIQIESETVTGQDVTQEYSDVSAQLRNLRATETELRELLTTVRQRTQKAADILEVFNQLTRVRGQIDLAQSRVTTLDKLIQLATVNVELVPDALAQPLSAEAWRPLTAVRSACRTLLSTLKWLFESAIWLLLYVVPVVLVVTIPAFGVTVAMRALWRRIRPLTVSS